MIRKSLPVVIECVSPQIMLKENLTFLLNQIYHFIPKKNTQKKNANSEDIHT